MRQASNCAREVARPQIGTESELRGIGISLVDAEAVTV